MKRLISCSISTFLLLASPVAFAQAPANSGAANVAAEGFEKVAKLEPPTDATEASIGAGGLLASGNSNTASLNATARIRLRRDANQAKAEAAGNYASTREEKDNVETKTTAAKNLQGILRYDHFFSPVVAGFVRASGLYDQVKLIDFRLNVALGAAFYIISRDKEELFVDIGYAPEKTWLHNAPDVPVRHNARVGAGYSASLSDYVNVSILGEYLIALNKIKSIAPGCTDANFACYSDDKHLNAQLFLGGRIDAKLSQKFSLATAAGLRWDGNPPLRNPSNPNSTAQFGFFDWTASLNLVYNLF